MMGERLRTTARLRATLGLWTRTASLSAVLVLAACSGSTHAGDRKTSQSRSSTTTSAAVSVDWSRLRNPIYAPAHMVKDIAVAFDRASWYSYGSERWEPSETDDRHAVVSTDLAHWTPLRATQHVVFNSPDLTRQADGTWLMTHQRTFGTGTRAVDRIVISAARSLAGPWSAPREILRGLFPGERLIDGAVAHTSDGLYLVAKRGDRTLIPQIAEVFHSPSGNMNGPWEHLGAADVGWTENFQLLQIDGGWHLLVTSIPIHMPVVVAMVGDPKQPSSWLHWRKVRQLDIPAERWNSPATKADTNPGFGFERANSAYLYDARAHDGYFYLFYAGSTELTSHDGRGLAHVGVARSRDLKTWTVPGT